MSDEYQLRKDIDDLRRQLNELDDITGLKDKLTEIEGEFDNYYDTSVIDTLINTNQHDLNTNLDLSSLDVDFDLNFGLSGRDDIVNVNVFLKQIGGV